MMMVLLTASSLMAVTFSSCTKSSTTSNDGSKFVGSWTGTSTCNGTTPVTVVFTAGSAGNLIKTSGSVGNGACYKAADLTFTASGNNFVGSQTLVDLCGNSYTLVTTASLSGSTLTYSTTATGAVSGTCTFTGTK